MEKNVGEKVRVRVVKLLEGTKEPQSARST